MTIIPVGELSLVRKLHKNKRIVFCSGSFDLTHAGHVLFFEDCKERVGPDGVLVVGVGSDKIIRAIKGEDRPVINEYGRAKVIDSLKPVDFTFIDNISTKAKPLQLLETVFENLRPDIYAITWDSFNKEHRKKVCEKYRIRLDIYDRTPPRGLEGISTTGIIGKIWGYKGKRFNASARSKR